MKTFISAIKINWPLRASIFVIFQFLVKLQVNLGVWGDDSSAAHSESPNSFYNQVQQQREVGSGLQPFEPPHQQPLQDQSDQSVPAELANQNNQQDQDQDNGFIKSKSNEKKDKKTKRAEEKKRAREREAKKAAANDYIPGMEGSVRPADEVVANDENDEDNQQRHYVRDFFLCCGAS